MKVPVRFIADKNLLDNLDLAVFDQAVNVASLSGLVGFVYVLPDAHSGYGAPIGCVFATDPEKGGIISPGAVGYDINCGMRLIATKLSVGEVKPYLEKLVDNLYETIPAGVGGKGFLKLSQKELIQVMDKGASWMVKKGFGWEEDLLHIEEKGAMQNANPQYVSQKAQERGAGQLATLGSGNHYLEIQKVADIFDQGKAKDLGIIQKDQIVIMLHCGSRGLGHQVCSDYLRIFENHMSDYNITVADRQLACVPCISDHGKRYFGAMEASANFAFANRQAITFQIRQVFAKVFGKSEKELGMNLIYDVTHNIAKLEQFIFNGRYKTLLVHRKGATRSYPNQPVIIGGSMETGSYLLTGTNKALDTTFGSTAHGSGRTMSRHAASKKISGKKLSEDLRNRGIYIKSASFGGLAEEAGFAYKNIDMVVDSVVNAEISKKVARFTPIGNIKG